MLFCAFFPLFHLCWPPSLTPRTFLWLGRRVQSSKSGAHLAHSSPPSLPPNSSTSLLQAEVDGLAEKASVSGTDYGLLRASAVYSGTILHHYALIISSHRTQRYTRGTACVCVCCALSNASTRSAACVHVGQCCCVLGMRVVLSRLWINFLWAESQIWT